MGPSQLHLGFFLKPPFSRRWHPTDIRGCLSKFIAEGRICMAEVKLHFRGWTVLLVIPIVLGLLWWRSHTVESALANGAGAEIRQHIAMQITNGAWDDLKSAYAEGGSEVLDAARENIVTAEDIEIVESGARGTGETITVKITFKVRGNERYDNTRYFQLKSTGIGNWRVRRECSSWQWYTQLF